MLKCERTEFRVSQLARSPGALTAPTWGLALKIGNTAYEIERDGGTTI
jgi:hypothetical protein